MGARTSGPGADRPERFEAETTAADQTIPRVARIYDRHSRIAYAGEERSEQALEDEREQLDGRIDDLAKAVP